MAKRTPQQISALWQKNLGAATDKIKQGVSAVTESPMAKAAAQQDLMRSRILDAIDSGRWAAALQATPLQTWKDNLTGKGLQNLQAGLAGGATGVAKYQTIAAPVQEQIRQAAAAIPKDGTTQTALRKVQVAIEGMKTLKGRMKTG